MKSSEKDFRYGEKYNQRQTDLETAIGSATGQKGE